MLVCSVTNDICKLFKKEHETREGSRAGRLRQPLVHGLVDLSPLPPTVALDEARCIGRTARRRAHVPSVEHHLSAVIVRVPKVEWRRRSR